MISPQLTTLKLFASLSDSVPPPPSTFLKRIKPNHINHNIRDVIAEDMAQENKEHAPLLAKLGFEAKGSPQGEVLDPVEEKQRLSKNKEGST